jgi:tetratricopeptide (TPR) repeat protein
MYTRHFIARLFLLHCLTIAVCAQRGGVDPFNNINSTTNATPGYSSQGGTLVLVSVFAEDGKTKLDRQALIKATNRSSQAVNWQTTDDNSHGAIELTVGTYDIEISAVGYLTEQRDVSIAGAYQTYPLVISLRRDPSAMDLHIADADLPPKARKEARQAVSALKSGNLKDAKKKLTAADKLAPSSSDLNYLLGYLSYQEKDMTRAQTYLANAGDLNPRHSQALTLLGRVDLNLQDYPAAETALQKAVRANPDYWMAHDLLATTYLKQKEYAKAKEEAELAIEEGKAAASMAKLTLGQALVDLGNNQEGLQVLKAFVQESPKNPTVPQVRDLIKSIEERSADPALQTETARKAAPPLAGIDPMLASPDVPLWVKSWEPQGIDDIKPSVASGVNCPSEEVMEKSGERVKTLVDDVSRIAAIEHLLHQRMDEMGNPATKETRNYNYVASITEPKPGFLQVDEDRSERLTRFEFPDEIATSGFMGLALVFHPSMRDNFEMTCEGLGRWHGQAAWLVHFKQREDRPARIHDYRVGGDIFSLRLKGRAWITADKFQIVRIQSELINPMPQIQLRNERQVVEYGPVQFHGKNVELWLPQKAELYLDFRKHRYYRSHTFDHYMLFSVDSEEKRNEPKVPSVDPNEKPLPN